jgi:hypothetical protein
VAVSTPLRIESSTLAVVSVVGHRGTPPWRCVDG